MSKDEKPELPLKQGHRSPTWASGESYRSSSAPTSLISDEQSSSVPQVSSDKIDSHSISVDSISARLSDPTRSSSDNGSSADEGRKRKSVFANDVDTISSSISSLNPFQSLRLYDDALTSAKGRDAIVVDKMSQLTPYDKSGSRQNSLQLVSAGRRNSQYYPDGWHPHDRRDSATSMYSNRSISSSYGGYGSSGTSVTSYSSYSHKFCDFPIPPQQPIIVFPIQYSWPPVSPVTANGVGVANGPPSGGSGRSDGRPPDNSDRGIAIDPALSSVRSSAGGSGQPSTGGLPELRLPDETMASAIGSPKVEGGLADISFEGMDGSASAAGDLLGLPEDEGSKGSKDAPFSRSPELRVSHKLAERKRRKEMKDLFDELRESLPADRGMKASKWEILSKAVDFITHMKSQNNDMAREIEALRRELDMARTGGVAGAYPPPHGYHGYPVATQYPPQGGYPASGAAAITSSSTGVASAPLATPSQDAPPRST